MMNAESSSTESRLRNPASSFKIQEEGGDRDG